KLKSTYSFVDALMHSSQMDEDLWKALVVSQHGVDVILSPESPVENIPTHEVAAMIEYCRETYGAIILDTSSPYGEWGEQVARLWPPTRPSARILQTWPMASEDARRWSNGNPCSPVFSPYSTASFIRDSRQADFGLSTFGFQGRRRRCDVVATQQNSRVIALA